MVPMYICVCHAREEQVPRDGHVDVFSRKNVCEAAGLDL